VEKAPEKGNIRDYSIPQLLILFHKDKKTGTLIFTNKDVQKSIYFVNGEIIFARSNMNSDRLDDMLLRKGKITEEQYHKVSEVFEKTKKRKGTILVEMGFIEPQSLFTVIREHVREIILSLFEWQEGEYSFRENIPSIEVVTLDSSIVEIIREGIKRSRNARDPNGPFMKRLNELSEKIDTMTYYDLLGVKMDAPYSEIKKAYLEKVKEYHPDRHRKIKDYSLREKLSKVLTLMNEAYNTLKDEKRRNEYNRYFLKGIRDATTTQNKTAEEYFIRGIDDYRKGNFWSAADLFQKATRIEPENARYWAHLSLSLSKIPRRAKDAESAILKAIDLEPYNIEYYMHLGRFYLNMGMRLRAKTQFEKALKIDPDNLMIKEEFARLRSGR
jgi:curved DNA-binding protein CbpA